MGEIMQKYKLVYENESDFYEIPLQRYNDSYETELEICFIDSFTTVFEDDQDCIRYLYEKDCIPDKDGFLSIKRPNGKVQALDIIYNNLDFRKVSYKLIQSLRTTDTSHLQQTSELNSCTGPLIRYFIDDKTALETLKKTFGYKEDHVEFLKHLIPYVGLIDKGFYTPEEVAIRNRERKYIYSKLFNYNFLRELLVWVEKYKNDKIVTQSKTNSHWKNPHEVYEKKKEKYHHSM